MQQPELTAPLWCTTCRLQIRFYPLAALELDKQDVAQAAEREKQEILKAHQQAEQEKRFLKAVLWVQSAWRAKRSRAVSRAFVVKRREELANLVLASKVRYCAGLLSPLPTACMHRLCCTAAG